MATLTAYISEMKHDIRNQVLTTTQSSTKMAWTLVYKWL